jgi:hypothetical protein
MSKPRSEFISVQFLWLQSTRNRYQGGVLAALRGPIGYLTRLRPGNIVLIVTKINGF